MAPYTGTQQWHHVHSPKVGRHLPAAIAHYNGTLVPRPIRQSGSSPSPPIGSKNPYSYRYLGKKGQKKTKLAIFVVFPGTFKVDDILKCPSKKALSIEKNPKTCPDFSIEKRSWKNDVKWQVETKVTW